MRYVLIPILTATCATAQDDNITFTCQGTDPEWELSVSGDAATFDYRRTSDMTLMLTTLPDGQDWPRAYTFIGRGDSAIAIIEGGENHPARILTQRGETPVLLTGICDLD